MSAVGCLREETVAAFVEGRLSSDALADAERHAAGCQECQALLGVALRSGRPPRSTALPPAIPSSASLPRGTMLGRYTILGLAGRGGMSEVYAAYDPETDRKVALKLLNASVRASLDGDARLQREARALAKVSHPNVVPVHDVGTWGGRVFIAMEFIDGPTLRQWLAERPRPIDEVLAVFGMAGRGLAAAHTAGLIHRDFKPENVMLSPGGAARVTDFGLVARLEDAPAHRDGAAPHAGPLDAQLTETGDLVGTPRYMSPEQLRGEQADARSDQFSFCVALYESVFGADPFGAGPASQRAARVLAGEVGLAPARAGVPRWLRRTLVRGLSAGADARWPSMTALLDALQQDPARTGRRGLALVAAMGLVALAAVSFTQRAKRRASLCKGGPAQLAAIWPQAGAASARRRSVAVAFLGSGAPAADESWARVEPALDRYAGAWLTMFSSACENGQRDAQAPDVLDLRMACLEDRRTALGALTDVFAKADKGVVAKAVDAVNALPPLARCADLEQLRVPIEPPADRATQARVDEIRRAAAVAKALNDTGRHPEAMARIEELTSRARSLGYRPLLAELLERQAVFHEGANFSAGALAVAEDAIWTGVATGRDDLAATAATTLVGMSYYRADIAAGWRWAKAADALLSRAGGRHELTRAWLLHDVAILHSLEGRLQVALDLTNESVALKKKNLGPEHPDVAIGLNSIAELTHRMGNDVAALVVNAESLRILSAAYGPMASETCLALSNRGEYMVALGQADESIPVSRDAIACWTRQHGPEHQFVAYPLTALGRAWLKTRPPQPEEAARALERALRIRKAHEPDQTLVDETWQALRRARAAAPSSPIARSHH
jgi:tetratricopeptide (TPR) repeat protein